MQFIELMTKDFVGQMSLFTIVFATVVMVGLPIYFFIKSGQKKEGQK
jgi:hypothetical protein